MQARIIDTLEGRLILTELKAAVGDKTHCLEFHRRAIDGGGYDVEFVMLTRGELGELGAALVEMGLF